MTLPLTSVSPTQKRLWHLVLINLWYPIWISDPPSPVCQFPAICSSCCKYVKWFPPSWQNKWAIVYQSSHPQCALNSNICPVCPPTSEGTVQHLRYLFALANVSRTEVNLIDRSTSTFQDSCLFTEFHSSSSSLSC